MDIRYLIVPYALTDAEPRVLLTRVQFIQTRARSKKIRGQIPDHAGQWTLVDGEASAATAVDTAAFQLFRACTGLNLADPEVVARYGLSAPRIEKLQDANYNSFTVLYIQAGLAGLEELTSDVERNINEPSNLVDGVYADAEMLRLSQALERIGPVPPPQDGWSDYIVKNYYVTEGPCALDTVYPTLVNQIAQRSRMSGELYAIALKKLPGGVQPAKPRLVRLEVENAQLVSGADNSYAANYDAGANAIVHAVIEPKGAPVTIEWQGGAPDPSGSGDVRIIPLSQVTRVGQPVRVTATLGASKQSMSLIVRPLLDRFEVVNATRSSELGPSGGVWVAEASEDEPPVRISIVTKPDSAEAHEHLQWAGGTADPEGRKNCRVILRTEITGPDSPVRVRAAVNPWWDFVLYVVPQLRRLEVVAGAGVYHVGGANYQVDYQAAPATYTIRATTWPDIPLSYQVLTWSNGAPPGQQIQITRSNMDHYGAPNPYSVAVRRAGVTLRSLTINVLVQPTVVALTFSGYVFRGGGNWHSYAAAGMFGLPANLSMQVTAQTNPNNQFAWAHLVWLNTSGGLPSLADRRIDLNVVQNINVSAQVGLAPPVVLPLDIRAPQAWPAGGPQIRVQQITFGGPGSRPVVHDDPGNVNTPFNRNWVFGTAHALQSPLTYTRNTNATITATITTQVPSPGPVNVDIRATAFVPRHNQPLHRMRWRWNANAFAGPPPPPLAPLQLAVPAANPTLPNEVVYADPMFMFWEMRIGAGNWQLFDVTSHILYVTLANPIGYTMATGILPVAMARCYYTVLAISCLRAHGETTNAGVVTANFTPFAMLTPLTGANANVRRKLVGAPHQDLTYWNPNAGSGQTLATMLGNAAGNGTCLAWAEMFVCMAALHGIALNNVEVRPNTWAVAPMATHFLVSNWTFHAPPAASGTAFTHTYAPAGAAVGPNAVWGPGLAGQNSPIPPPSFGNHFIVRDVATGTFYDPSYGSGPHAGLQNWINAASDGLRQGAMAGYARTGVPPAAPNFVRLRDLITQVFLN